MPDFSKHPYFTPWTDPETQITSYLLTERVAPVQRGNYFIQPSLSAGGEWLWFLPMFPPSRGKFVAAARLDPAEPEIKLFPHSLGSANPLPTESGDAAYITIERGIYRQPFDGEPEPIAELPDEIASEGYVFRIATGLTLSSDEKHFLMDARVGNRFWVCIADRHTGEVTPLESFADQHHHAYWSPHDPELFLVNRGHWLDPISGWKFSMQIRQWVMNTRRTRYEPVLPDLWFGHNCMACHEWWTPDGKINWCDYNDGIYETDVSQRCREAELIWDQPSCHGMCDPTGRYYVADENPYHRTGDRPVRVWFWDRRTGKQIAIVSKMPLPELHHSLWRPCHIDPHPHFSADGKYIIYTTTARGPVDVAITPVDEVLPKL